MTQSKAVEPPTVQILIDDLARRRCQSLLSVRDAAAPSLPWKQFNSELNCKTEQDSVAGFEYGEYGRCVFVLRWTTPMQRWCRQSKTLVPGTTPTSSSAPTVSFVVLSFVQVTSVGCRVNNSSLQLFDMLCICYVSSMQMATIVRCWTSHQSAVFSRLYLAFVIVHITHVDL